MLVYILFFYLFRNTPSPGVDASPIFNFTSNSTSFLPDSVTSHIAQPDSSIAITCDCNQRSTIDIAWSCIATLFLCTWSSIHPNMSAPKDEWWRILWRRLKSMYWALVAPELVLTWAVRQWVGARNILIVCERLSIRMSQFISVGKVDIYDSTEPKWSKKHAHFLQMGGFHLRDPESGETSLLEIGKFFELLYDNTISIQYIDEKDIEDKSKADALTKIVVIFQTLWFVIQCIGRHVQGLALAQLEVATLAVISCTFILCVVWWDKPFDAQQPIYLNRLSRSDSSSRGASSESANISRGQIEIPTIPHLSHLNLPVEKPEVPTNNNAAFQPEDAENPSNTLSSISPPVATPPHELEVAEVGLDGDLEKPSKIQAFLQKISAPIILFYLIVYTIYRAICITISITYKSVQSTISSICQAISTAVIEEDTSKVARVIGICFFWPLLYPIMDLVGSRDETNPERVGSYYSWSEIGNKLFLLPVSGTALLGLVHCISWGAKFPSAVESVLWRISAVTVGSFLAVFGLLVTISIAISNDGLQLLISFGIVLGFLAYISGRYYLLIEAFLSLRALPPSAFQTVEWSDFIPHM